MSEGIDGRPAIFSGRSQQSGDNSAHAATKGLCSDPSNARRPRIVCVGAASMPKPPPAPRPTPASTDDGEDAWMESLTADDVGLPETARLPFRFTPARTWSPLVVSFPHVGLTWPHDLRPKPQADFARNADYQVQTLYPALEQLGIARLEAVYSRLVVDLNRADDDVSRQLVPDHPAPAPRSRAGVNPAADAASWDRPGRGVVWASAVAAGAGASVRILQPPLPYSAFARRIARYHTPYHQALELLLRRRRERFGYAVLLDAHSMPSSVGIDLVLGTLDGASCSEDLVDAAMATLQGDEGEREALLSVRRDSPYRGGEVVRKFGRPAHGFHALQLEVSRRLYMDEQTYSLRPHPSSTDVSPGHTSSRTEDGQDVGTAAAIGAGQSDPRQHRSMRHALGRSRASQRGAAELAELLRRVRSLVWKLAKVRTSLGESSHPGERASVSVPEPAPS